MLRLPLSRSVKPGSLSALLHRQSVFELLPAGIARVLEVRFRVDHALHWRKVILNSMILGITSLLYSGSNEWNYRSRHVVVDWLGLHGFKRSTLNLILLRLMVMGTC